MDNQQDQFGASTPTNAGRNPQNQPATPGTSRPTAGSPESTASGAAASSHKSAPMPNVQSSSFTPGSTIQNQKAVDNDRQGEDQQNNSQEGPLLDMALQGGKKWIENSGMLNSVNQLPQALKDLGNRAVTRVGDLSTTQKVVGGALLAVGLGWLVTRKGKSSDSSAPYKYGRAKSGDYGRQSYGYQAPDASTSRQSDSGAAYGGSASRYGNPSIYSDSGSGFEASAAPEHGAQSAKGSTYGSRSDLGNSSNE